MPQADTPIVIAKATIRSLFENMVLAFEQRRLSLPSGPLVPWCGTKVAAIIDPSTSIFQEDDGLADHHLHLGAFLVEGRFDARQYQAKGPPNGSIIVNDSDAWHAAAPVEDGPGWVTAPI
jgi:hypothetical protein